MRLITRPMPSNKEKRNYKLREFRLYFGQNQESFAYALGLKQGSYADIERGKTGMSEKVLKKLMTTYGFNPVWYYLGKGDMILDESIWLHV